MPITSGEDRGFKRFIPQSQQEAEKKGPAIFDVVQAAFETENTIVNFAANGFSFGESFQPEENYNPFDKDIKGFEIYADSFIESRSRAQTEAIKTKVSQETLNREILSNGGATSVVATIAAGLTDPIYWPLMMIGVGEARLAKTTGEAFLKAAAIGGAAEVPAEVAKSGMQETRTLEESALNVGGAALLSGILGGGVHKLTKGTDVDPEDLMKKIEQNTSSSSPDLSMGAAQVRTLTEQELELVGLAGLEKIPVSPLIRTSTSPSLDTKDITTSLVETPLVSKGNIEGITVVPEGGAAETRIKRWDANLYNGLAGLRDSYAAYKGANKGKTLPLREFRIEVGKAMRRGDEHAIPEVAKAAKILRREVFDPLKDEAISGGMLPRDVDVTTSSTYLTRVYNFDKIVAKRPEWDSIIDGWLSGIRSAAKVKLDMKVAAGKAPSPSLKGEAGISDLEIAEIRNQVTDKILGVNSGRLPYEVTLAERGPLKERTFQIPDRLIEDFLESDVDVISRQYLRTMAPDVEINRMFGDVTMKAEIERINNSYARLRDAATSEKERVRLEKKRNSDVRDIEAMRDRLRGTHGAPSDPNSFFVKAGRTLRDVNFMSLLGGMTLSAIPDAARLVAVNGFKPVSKGLAQLASSPSRFKLAATEAKKAAVGLDMVLNSRASSLAELTDAYQRGSAFERGTRAVSDAFSKLTLMTQWNAGMKQFAGTITSDRIVLESMNWAAGKISKSAIKRMAASGIDELMAIRIADQFKKYGDDGTLKLINGDAWDDAGALDTFRSAVLKDVDRTIVTPGVGEKPLWTSAEMGKTIFQFKTFAASAHHKVLMSDLQFRDAAALNGLLLSTALGTMAYGMKQWTAGREISSNPNQVLVESLDRSGVWGYFWDVNNIAAKMTNGEVSIQSAIGADPVSRYASRNIIGAMFGPSIGKIEDVRAVTGSVSSEGELSESDIRKMRQFMPGQNLFYIRRILDGLEEKMQ